MRYKGTLIVSVHVVKRRGGAEVRYYGQNGRGTKYIVHAVRSNKGEEFKAFISRAEKELDPLPAASS